MTNILGYHLIVLGVGALAWSLNWCFIGGAYDTWAPGGGGEVSQPNSRSKSNIRLSI